MSKTKKITNCVRRVISPLLANIFLHVVFDKWMDKHHPEKPFERYADDIVVHCKTEKQALYVLKMIQQRMKDCKLTLHPVKTKIINLRGKSEKKYLRSFDFLGFTICSLWSKISKGNKLMVASGNQAIFDNRVGWAKTYLKKAGLLDSPKRATFVITDVGLQTLAKNPTF